MKKILVLLFLSAGLGISYLSFSFFKKPNPTLTAPIVIDVSPGSTFTGILKKLSENHIQIPEIPAKIIARFLKLDKKIKPGEFQLTPPLSSMGILENIMNGKGILHNLLIKEGFNRWDIKAAWAELPFFNENEFEKIMKDKELMDKAGIPNESLILSASQINTDPSRQFTSLEGFLFPETYSFQKYDSIKSVVTEMLNQFDGRARDILSNHPWGKTKIGFYRLLTLASIVEKESGNGEEQPMVASVFWNRLDKKMRLQSDPTTIYGLMPNFDGNLKRIHLESFGIFNTYKIPELPVGPISNPGEKALRAVLHPASSKYLYFVSRGDGTHIFAEDYKSHDKNVKTFQLKH